MSPICLLVTLVAVVFVAAQPPIRDSLVGRLPPVLRDSPLISESESSHSFSSIEESDEHFDHDLHSQNAPLVRAHKDYRYTPLFKHPRSHAALSHYRPKVIERPVHPKSQTTRYNFCGIGLSGNQNHKGQVDVEPTIIPPKKDVELVYGNYCASQPTGGNKVLGMQVIACDLGGKEKPYVIEQLHHEDTVKFNHFDVFGTPGGVIVFAKQFCGSRLG